MPRFQYSLRTVFIVITLLAIGCGYDFEITAAFGSPAEQKAFETDLCDYHFEITAMSGDLVEISGGSDDGFQKRMNLAVTRVADDKVVHVAKIELVRVDANRSVGRVVSVAPKVVLKKGDVVIPLK